LNIQNIIGYNTNTQYYYSVSIEQLEMNKRLRKPDTINKGKGISSKYGS